MQSVHADSRGLEREICRLPEQVKLSMRAVPVGHGAPPVSKPFLTFTCRGANLNMVQDLPISKPHPPARAHFPLPTPLVHSKYGFCQGIHSNHVS